jgi:hypothetical protein
MVLKSGVSLKGAASSSLQLVVESAFGCLTEIKVSGNRGDFDYAGGLISDADIWIEVHNINTTHPIDRIVHLDESTLAVVVERRKVM